MLIIMPMPPHVFSLYSNFAPMKKMHSYMVKLPEISTSFENAKS